MSIDALQLVRQQGVVTGRGVHYHCPGCGRLTRDKQGMCIGCRRSRRPLDLSKRSLEDLIALRSAIAEEMAQRAEVLKQAMGTT